MNGLQDLIAKLQKIEEADAPAPAAAAPAAAAPAPAAAAPETMDQVVDRREKAAAAKQILKTMVKKKSDLDMVNGYYIEAETGTLLHSMIANRSMGGQPSGTVVTTRDIGFGQGKAFADQLTAVGLKITPETVNNPGIFGWKWTESSKTILKINLKDLEKIAVGAPPTNQPPPAAVPAANAPAAVPAANAPAANAPAANAPAAVPAANAPAAPAAAGNPEIQKKIDRVKQIVGVNNSSSGYTANGQQVSPPAAVPAGAPIASNLAESIKFKSRIGRLLAEEFGVLEADIGMPTKTPTPREELDTLWNELTTFMKTPDVLTPEQRKDIEMLTQLVNDFRTTGTVKPAADSPTKANNAPSKDVQALATNNKIADPNKISIGQKITLPDGSTYTVVKGDTLSAIQAGKYKGTPPAKAGSPSAPAAAAPAAAAPAAAPGTTVVKPRPTLKGGKVSTGPKARDWDKLYGATHNPDGTPKAAPAAAAPAAAAPAAAAPAATDVQSDAKAATATIKDVPPLPTLPATPPPKGVGFDPLLGGTGNQDYIKWLTTNVKGKPGDFYWIHGDRYKLTGKGGHGGTKGGPNVGTWQKDAPWGAGDRTNQLRNYTGPEGGEADKFAKAQQQIWYDAMHNRMRNDRVNGVKESTGFANDELSRIVSLVHHR